jgi:hypothetical protein
MRKWEFSSVLCAGVIAPLAISSLAAYSAPAYVPVPEIKIEDKALADTISAALKAASARNYVEAIAQARAAERIENKPPHLGPVLRTMIINYAIWAKDYQTAIGELEKKIAAGEGNAQENLTLRGQLTSESREQSTSGQRRR